MIIPLGVLYESSPCKCDNHVTFEKNGRIVLGIVVIELAKITGITPAGLTFNGR